MSDLFEQLAAIEHERWASWQKYLHSLCIKDSLGNLTMSANRVQHWERQIETSYTDLSEREKEMDRDQVRKYWHLINES